MTSDHPARGGTFFNGLLGTYPEEVAKVHDQGGWRPATSSG
jgi:hypothetical protein